MPITDSAKKALRQNKRHRKQNVRNMRRLKTAVKQYEKLLATNKDEAMKFLSNVYQMIDKVLKSKYIKKNTAARMKSRLAKKLALKH